MLNREVEGEGKKFLFWQDGSDTMVTPYHKCVEDGILLYAEYLHKNKKIREFFKGNTRPLSLVDPDTKSVVNYQPDVYFILRNNKKMIFEVLDSEEKKQDIIIADIICSFLVENVEALIFIHPGRYKFGAIILEALEVMYKGLTDKGIDISKLPSDKKTAPYRISEKLAVCPENVFKKLIRFKIV